MKNSKQQVTVYSFLKGMPKSAQRKWLLEEEYTHRYSLIKKIYYSLIRKLIPLRFRHKLQRFLSKNIQHKPNFIDSEMVDYVWDSNFYRKQLLNIYPKPYTWALVLTHDIETLDGLNRVQRIMEVEDKLGLSSSWNIVPYSYPIDEGIIKYIKGNRHELGIHGYNHDGKLYSSSKVFNSRVPYINQALAKYGALGFRSPMMHRNLNWLQALNISYDSSCFDYDIYQPFPGGVKSIWPFIAGHFVELPYTLPQDHTIFVVLGMNDFNVLKKKAEWIIAHNGVVLMLTHPDYLNTPGRITAYKEFLEFLISHENGWHILPHKLATWWKEKMGIHDTN